MGDAQQQQKQLMDVEVHLEKIEVALYACRLQLIKIVENTFGSHFRFPYIQYTYIL